MSGTAKALSKNVHAAASGMTAFAIIPFGAWLAFSVAAIVTISDGGSGIAGTCVFLWGTVVMLAGDHFVWPTLVSGSARLPFLLTFVGIFGGLAAFGLMGPFVRPVIMAALLAMARVDISIPASSMRRSRREDEDLVPALGPSTWPTRRRGP